MPQSTTASRHATSNDDMRAVREAREAAFYERHRATLQKAMSAAVDSVLKAGASDNPPGDVIVATAHALLRASGVNPEAEWRRNLGRCIPFACAASFSTSGK